MTRSSSNGRSLGARGASSARPQTSFRQAQARPTGQNFRSSGFGSRSSGFGYRGFGGGGFGRHFSDIRLKQDIVPLGRLDSGIGVYRFRYRGNDHTRYVGVMAQEVKTIVPDAVSRGRDGYLRVDYDRLGVNFLTWDEWVAGRSAQFGTLQ
jgi:hypothetical protein